VTTREYPCIKRILGEFGRPSYRLSPSQIQLKPIPGFSRTDEAIPLWCGSYEADHFGENTLFQSLHISRALAFGIL
jgi:hypothetical protein